jgi:hypothetical protein
LAVRASIITASTKMVILERVIGNCSLWNFPGGHEKPSIPEVAHEGALKMPLMVFM